MKSRTKSFISKEKILELVKNSFGKEVILKEIVELKGGLFNSAYLLKLENPTNEVVLKLGVLPDTEILSYEKDIMRTEVAVYELIRKNTSVPVPEILKYDFSRTSIECDYFFMSKLQGNCWKDAKREFSKEDFEMLKEEIGKYTAQLHSIKGEYFGYFSEKAEKQYNTWSEAFKSMLEKIIADGKERKVKLPYQQILTIIENNTVVLDEVKEACLVDFDLWAGNVFVAKRDGKYHVEGILDLERAFWGDPCADFISAVMIYSDVSKEQAFQKGYIKMIATRFPLTHNDECRMLMYRVYLTLIMSIEAYRYNGIYRFLIRAYCKGSINKYLKQLKFY